MEEVMKWLYKAERKFGKYAISNLMKYIVFLYVIGFVLTLTMPDFYYSWLALDIEKILQGQVWRVVTFLIQPPGSNIFFVLISVYLYYMIGTSLENAWGSFLFNLYFLMGIVFNILAAVIFYAITGLSYPIGIEYINQSLFFAFAALYPNMQFTLFFLIPIKVKYLAWIYGALMGYEVLSNISMGIRTGQLLFIGFALAVVVAMANFLIFFFMTRNYKRMSPAQMKRKAAFKREIHNAERSRGQAVYRDGHTVITRHKCAVCGRSELDDDNLEFRFCSKCNGNYEYCSDHLFTHQHVQ